MAVLPLFVIALALGAMVILVQAVVRISNSMESMARAVQDLAVSLRNKTY
jgi:hypothetical protein